MKTILTPGFAGRFRGLPAALLVSGVVSGCDLLDVENPGAITEPELEEPARIPLMVHGVLGEFQRAYGWYTLYTGTFSGELTDTHVWRENIPINLRDVDEFNGLLATNYTRLQRTRAAGDDAAARIRQILGAEAEQHVGLARALAYAGYALTLLAEAYCQAPINVSAAHQPDALFAMALERFDDAIGVATAARAVAGNAASADSLLALARVGAARAALNRGEAARAADYAREVPADFEFWVAFSDNSSAEYNQFWNATREINAHLQPGPEFMEMNDPRIPMSEEPVPLQTPAGIDLIHGHIPLVPFNYQGWTAAGNTLMIQQNTDVRFASGLEARYIVAEVEGPTAATLALVNERRAVGEQDPVDLAGDALMAELRDQRRRDLYLTGHRMGDLRRYLDAGVGDFFLTGSYPFDPDRQYTTGTCFPIPLSELNSNPNL